MGSSDDFAENVRRYLEDVEQTVARVLEDLERYAEWCNHLEAYVSTAEDAKDKRKNMYVTTLVSIFIPFQLLTGVYGMNFTNEHGSGVVPLLGELTVENSYYTFWGLGLCLTVVLIAFF